MRNVRRFQSQLLYRRAYKPAGSKVMVTKLPKDRGTKLALPTSAVETSKTEVS
jgi:hypothetical protein